VATARSAATVSQILAGVRLNVPVILMNGACTYDLERGAYLASEDLNETAKRVLFQTLRQNNLEGFVYTLENGRLATYYERIETEAARHFVAEREMRYGKVFQPVDSFADSLMSGQVIYYSISDRRERLEPIRAVLAACSDLQVAFYRDVYRQDVYFLEVCARTASKYHAIQSLRLRYGFDRVVCFGDNHNDLPMFRASDEAYAVENALPDVKAGAAGVIGSNRHDGVANWLCRRFALKGVLPCTS
jgi:HAD superfamily hydrolase (TIGR01484 family)